jgi:nucleotide-binding universal stress UspA family protein
MKVLSATDFSPLAMQASDIAAMLADQTGTSSSVYLVHCAPDLLVSADIASTAMLMQRISDDLENEAARLRKAGAIVTADLR